MNALPPALVVVGHGSRSPEWISAFKSFVDEIGRTPGLKDVYASVTPAYLESAAPGLADAVLAQLALGVAEVVVVPVFLTASSHLTEDIPGILGVPGTSRHIVRRLMGEGVPVLPEGLPIRVASLGDVREVLFRNVSRRLALESRDRRHEGVVLVAYGSTIHHDRWETLLHGLRADLLGAGWAATQHAYCGHVVQLSPDPTRDAIVSVASEAGVRRVHVKPLLLARSALQTGPIAAGVAAAAELLQRRAVEVIHDGDAILPDGDLAARAGHAALHALGITPPLGGRRLGKPAGDA
jgi:sirohydrochlorin ferrochelatase